MIIIIFLGKLWRRACASSGSPSIQGGNDPKWVACGKETIYNGNYMCYYKEVRVYVNEWEICGDIG